MCIKISLFREKGTTPTFRELFKNEQNLLLRFKYMVQEKLFLLTLLLNSLITCNNRAINLHISFYLHFWIYPKIFFCYIGNSLKNNTVTVDLTTLLHYLEPSLQANSTHLFPHWQRKLLSKEESNEKPSFLLYPLQQVIL